MVTLKQRINIIKAVSEWLILAGVYKREKEETGIDDTNGGCLNISKKKWSKF